MPPSFLIAALSPCALPPRCRYVAIGLFNGNVSIRDKEGQEKVVITRPGHPPVWSLQWSPAEDRTDVLAVADWNQVCPSTRLAVCAAVRPVSCIRSSLFVYAHATSQSMTQKPAL